MECDEFADYFFQAMKQIFGFEISRQFTFSVLLLERKKTADRILSFWYCKENKQQIQHSYQNIFNKKHIQIQREYAEAKKRCAAIIPLKIFHEFQERIISSRANRGCRSRSLRSVVNFKVQGVFESIFSLVKY